MSSSLNTSPSEDLLSLLASTPGSCPLHSCASPSVCITVRDGRCCRRPGVSLPEQMMPFIPGSSLMLLVSTNPNVSPHWTVRCCDGARRRHSSAHPWLAWLQPSVFADLPALPTKALLKSALHCGRDSCGSSGWGGGQCNQKEQT